MNPNNAGLTDDQIEALAKKHIAPHADRLDAIMTNPVPYQQTEQFRRVKALISDVLSELRAPVADERAAFEAAIHDEYGVSAPSMLLRDADGDYVTMNTEWVLWLKRAALASAPVAGETVNLKDAREYLDQWGCLANPNVRALLENAERVAKETI